VPAIQPFRGLRYASGPGADLDRLTAPPYDVISEERRAALAARHAHNIVHLDLPRPGTDGDAYRTAASLLQEWLRAGVLQREDRPSFYACEQRYRAPSGEERTRRGFFGRLRLEPLDGGVVIPHERTLDRPRADRQRLLAATRTHLSAVFLLHPDPGHGVAGLLEEALRDDRLEQARDDEGTLSRVARIAGPLATADLVRRIEEARWALIADGHHRYESALAYRDERRALGRRDAEHVLAFLCSLEDPGVAIFPIHRLVRSLEGFEPQKFSRRLGEFFRLTPVAGEEALRAALAERRARPGVFGFALRGAPGFLLTEWKEGAGLELSGMAPIPEPLRRLDVILLHRLVLEEILGISAEAQARQVNLDYVKDDRQWLGRMDQGGADIGILMNPTRIEQVIAVTRKGLRLPQKSTYFHPKVLTGLVLDPLDDGGTVS